MNIEKIPHKHEWFRTGEMKVGQMRCISCGTWAEEEMPKSKWIGLTEQEIEKAIPYKNLSGEYSYDDVLNIVLFVQAKLKEKNHG
jgi:hypothetical protein